MAVHNYGVERKTMECPGNLRSSMWSLGGVRYKDVDKLRTIIMEYIYIYGYVSFGLGVLFLIGLILFSWMALRKICQCSFQ
jgi:hypothetical protein